jgi:TonB family protein
MDPAVNSGMRGNHREPVFGIAPVMLDYERARRREPVLEAMPAPPDREPLWRRDEEDWRHRLRGPAGSLALHLAMLLALLFGWRMPAPVEHPPIPVQVVFQPPPKPPVRTVKRAPPSRPHPSRPHRGPIASEDFGDTKRRDLGPVNREGAAPTNAALPLDTAKPSAPALPKAPGMETAAAPRPPEKPLPPPEPRPVHRASYPRRMTTRLAKYPGMAATKDEYMAYLAALARQHLDLLPLSLIGKRQGETVIGVVVRDNGTIAMMQVVKSSGYPDIDRRVEAIITAVGRFPPLPQWFQGPAMAIEFSLRFPGVLLQ